MPDYSSLLAAVGTGESRADFCQGDVKCFEDDKCKKAVKEGLTVKSKGKDGKAVEIVVSRAAETKVIDDNEIILASSIVPYGATIFIKKGPVKKGDKITKMRIAHIDSI